MKKFFTALLVALSSFACSSQTVSGQLTSVTAPAGYDWHYVHSLDQPRSAMFQVGVPVTLKATFIYGGNSGNIPGSQHAILNYSQVLAADSFFNNSNQALYTHGAGAIVSEYGLAMELWFRTPNAQGSYVGQPGNAYVWSSLHGRCLRDVLGTITGQVACLSDNPNDPSFITTNPNWVFKRQTKYTLEVTYTPTAGGWVTMEANLLEARYSFFGWTNVSVQRARVGFQAAQFFPDPNQFLTATVARTPGTSTEPFIDYTIKH